MNGDGPTASISKTGKGGSRTVPVHLELGYHPLFTEVVEGFIRDGLANINIGFDRATYSYSKKEFVDANNDL